MYLRWGGVTKRRSTPAAEPHAEGEQIIVYTSWLCTTEVKNLSQKLLKDPEVFACSQTLPTTMTIAKIKITDSGKKKASRYRGVYKCGRKWKSQSIVLLCCVYLLAFEFLNLVYPNNDLSSIRIFPLYALTNSRS